MKLLNLSKDQLRAVKLLNDVNNTDALGLVFERIWERLPSDDDSNLFNVEEKQKLKNVLSLDDINDINHLLDFSIQLIKQLAFQLVKVRT